MPTRGKHLVAKPGHNRTPLHRAKHPPANCKTVYSGSIPDVASTFEINGLGLVSALVSRPGMAPRTRRGNPVVWRSDDGRSMKHAVGDGASHAVQPIQ
jgi:hypothetical protein